MSSRSSRRTPWPWDARIASAAPAPPSKVVGDFRGHPITELHTVLIGQLRGRGRGTHLRQGLMLLPQPDSSLLVAKKQTNLENLYPTVAEYDSAPVYRERTFQFRPTGGLGEGSQGSAGSRRYHYGINVWVTGGYFGKGPLAHAVHPPGMPVTAGYEDIARLFIEARATTATEALFYIANRMVYVRSDDTDAGQHADRARAGHTPTDMARFQGGFAGAQDSLYVAWEDGVLEERQPGGIWTVCALPAGFHAVFLTVIGDELWAADAAASIIRKVSADPKIAANWGGPIPIGNPTSPISALKSTNNRLAIFKSTGGVFTVTLTGEDVEMFPGIESTRDIENGRAATAWLSSLWFRAGRAFYQLEMGDTAQLTPRGPGRNLGNLSEVRGSVQAFAGWNTQMAFAVIFNEQTNSSYLLSYGSWVPKADPDSQSPTVSGTSYTFVDQYDGALKKWAGRRATTMFVSNIPSEARLYVGFSDGGYDWFKLVPYPLLLNQGAEYTLDESYLVLPLHHAMFQSDNKHWTGVSVWGPQLGFGNRVRLQYRVMAQALGPGGSATGSWLPWGPLVTMNGERINPDVPVAGKALELRVNLENTDSLESPTLEGIGLHERLVPTFRRDYTLTVNANEMIARRDGASTRQSGETIRAWMATAAAAPASIALQLPDETLNDVALFSYEEHMVPHTQRGGQGFAINVQATQFTVLEVHGNIGRLRGTRIGDLRGYQISELNWL